MATDSKGAAGVSRIGVTSTASPRGRSRRRCNPAPAVRLNEGLLAEGLDMPVTSTATTHRIQSMRAKGATYAQIVEAVGCSERTIRAAIVGQIKPASKFAARIMPADFSERARDMTATGAKAAFGVSLTTVYHWASICGFTFRVLAKPVPVDFEAQYLNNSNAELATHYGVSASVVERWASNMTAAVRATHLMAVKHKISATAKKMQAERSAAKPVKAAKTKRMARMGKPVAGLIPEAKADVTSMAIRHLQRHYAPVCRADTFYSEKCKASRDAAAGLFRVGSRNVTESELMALAARKGFAVSSGFAG